MAMATPPKKTSKLTKNPGTKNSKKDFQKNLQEAFDEEYESIFDDNEEDNHTLTRAGIRLAFSHYLDLSTKEASDMLNIITDNLFELIVNCANDTVNKKGKRFVKISKFGTFLIHSKKERIGRNPKNKEEATISPRYSVSFRSSASLKACVNNQEEEEQKKKPVKKTGKKK